MTERYFGTYELSEDEIAEKSKQLAETLRALEAKEQEKKSVTSQFTADINGLKEEIYGLKNVVLDGKESAYFDCEVETDYKRQIKSFFYRGQKIGFRPLSEDERQLHMKDAI
jgi:hypothetical protein